MAKTIIVGAGLAGLITACKIQEADIYEAGKRAENHKALLRFRDDSVSRLTGIPFREVRVRKGIYWNGRHYAECNPMFANSYARKVTGRIAADRSIWSLETASRFIAPEDFYDRLVERHYQRIKFENSIHDIPRGNKHKIVSTAPLPVIMKLCGLTAPACDFSASPIEVRRFRLPAGTDVFQTIYFPELDWRTFRASITGNLLIVEQMKDCHFSFGWKYPEIPELDKVCASFGLDAYTDLEEIERVDQKYGKIVDIPRQQREAILYELTRDFNVFSIGRFATWRNILLDDVVKDIDIVQRLMESSTYGRELVLANR
jgi:hypothetical protein